MDYESYSDKEVYDMLEQAALAERIASDPNWALLKEAADRIVNRTIEKFACSTDPNDLCAIIEAQTTIRKYRFGLLEEVEILRQEAEHAFEEAKMRGLINKDAAVNTVNPVV